MKTSRDKSENSKKGKVSKRKRRKKFTNSPLNPKIYDVRLNNDVYVTKMSVTPLPRITQNLNTPQNSSGSNYRRGEKLFQSPETNVKEKEVFVNPNSVKQSNEGIVEVMVENDQTFPEEDESEENVIEKRNMEDESEENVIEKRNMEDESEENVIEKRNMDCNKEDKEHEEQEDNLQGDLVDESGDIVVDDYQHSEMIFCFDKCSEDPLCMLTSDGGKIKVNKKILCEKSTYFSSMKVSVSLESVEMRKGELNIQNLSFLSLKSYLELILNNKQTCDCSNLISLGDWIELILLSKFETSIVKAKISEWISRWVDSKDSNDIQLGILECGNLFSSLNSDIIDEVVDLLSNKASFDVRVAINFSIRVHGICSSDDSFEEKIVDYPELLLEKFFPNSCLSRQYPVSETPDSEKPNQHDVFSQRLKNMTHEKKMEEAAKNIKRNEHLLCHLYGFCECHNRDKIDSIIVSILLEYKEFSMESYSKDEYKKPVFEKDDFKSPPRVVDLAILYLAVSNCFNTSFEALSATLHIWAAFLELSGFKINFPINFKGLESGINKVLESRRKKAIICIKCEDRVHLFCDHFSEKRNWKASELPYCPHCYKFVTFDLLQPRLEVLWDEVKNKPNNSEIYLSSIPRLLHQLFMDSNIKREMMSKFDNRSSNTVSKREFWEFMNLNCHHLNLGEEERIRVSPYRISSDGKLSPKDGHYIILSNPTHFMNDMIRQCPGIFKHVIDSNEGKSEVDEDFFQSTHGKFVLEYMKKEKLKIDDVTPLAVFCNYRVDDVHSFNNCASSVKTGVQSTELPQLGDLKARFSNIVVNSLSACKGKSWVIRVVQNYSLMRILTLNFINPLVMTKNGIKYSTRYIMYKKKMDMSDAFDTDRILSSSCTQCRVVGSKKQISITDKNGKPRKQTYHKFDNKITGLERSVYTVILPFMYSKEYVEGEIDLYRRGVKTISVFAELCVLYRYDYLYFNTYDFTHRIINLFNGLKPLVTKSLRKKADKKLHRNVTFHGKPRLLRNLTSMGNFKYTEKLDFFSTFSTEILIVFGADPNTISIFSVVRRMMRVIFSHEFEIAKWDKLFEMFKLFYSLFYPNSFPKTLHHLFCHIMKNFTRKVVMKNKTFIMRKRLFDYIRDDSTEDGESYYTLLRRLIKKNFQYDMTAINGLQLRTVLPILFLQIDVSLLNHERIGMISKRVLKRNNNNNMNDFNYPLYKKFSYAGGMKKVLPSFLNVHKRAGFSGSFESLLSYIIDLLQNYDGEKIGDTERLDLLKKLEEVQQLESNNNLDGLFPSIIELFQFTHLYSEKNDFVYISRNYRKTRLENINGHVAYFYPYEPEEEEEEEEEDSDYLFYRYVGRIWFFIKIKILGLERNVAVIQHHKRIGFQYIDRKKFSTDVIKLIEDVQIVEEIGRGFHCIDLKMIDHHVMLIRCEKMNLKVFETSARVRKCKDDPNAITKHLSITSRIVFELNDRK